MRIIIFLIAMILFSSGCHQTSAQTTGADKQSTETSDQLIDAGGYRLHIVCQGRSVKGQATVILDSGGGSSASAWKLVQPEVARFARVCSYDRPGLGASERKPKPYLSMDVMRDLHTLLVKAGLARPYVMVGHSLGGMHIRLFAKLYPQEVAGMVFVDSFNEDEPSRGRALMPPEILKKIPPEHLRVHVNEDLDFEASVAQARQHKWYGSIPLIVLTRAPLDRTKDAEQEMWPGQIENRERLRIDLQRDLASRSTRSRHLIAEKSGHNIQNDQPELVIESIRRIVEAVRSGNKKRF